MHSGDRERVERSVRTSVAEKKLYEVQFRTALPAGAARWIAAGGRVEYASNGVATRMQGVCRDITEKRSAELETQRLQLEIAHVGRVSVLGQLASALAHEINQPLGAILRNAEAAELFLRNDQPDLEEIRAILVDIRADDQRAGAVIDRMRALLKNRSLDMRPLELDELVSDVACLTRSDSLNRRIKLITDVPSSVPPISGDRIQLQQVMLNLVLNGMDARNGDSPGDRWVNVSARVDEATMVEITVRDSGHGIPPEKVAQIFDPFFTTKAEGLGMGLPISRTIVEAHGGRLWAESNDSAGATFRFTLRSHEPALS